MRISQEDLAWAASQGVITPEQAEGVWRALQQRRESRPRFDVPNLAYYLGALIVMSAMGWFMTLGWERFGGAGIFGISALYALCFGLAGRALWAREESKTPGGLLVTMAVWMTPLAIYGLERAAGLWTRADPGAFRGYHFWVHGSWFLMEVGTILAGAIALRFVRFPFLTFPIAFSLWYMSMDLTPLLFGQAAWSSKLALWVSLGFGFALLLASLLVDRRTKEDYAFWGYLFGMLAFWIALCGLVFSRERSASMHGFLLINVALMLVSVLLQRRVFIVFGAVGVFWYLSYLAYSVFKNSMVFPFALTVIGLAIIYAGLQYQRHAAGIEAWIHRLIPGRVRRLLPQARAS